MAVWSRLLATAGFAALAICLTACRDDSAAAVSFTEDLGSEARPLPPPSAPVMIAKIREGTAELPPLRNPTLTEATDDPGAGGDGEGAPAGDAPSDAAPFDAAAIETEIRGIVDEYNEYAVKAAFDDLTNFYVASQQDAAARLHGAVKGIYDEVKAIETLILAAKPDAKERLDAIRAKMLDPEDLKLNVISLEVASATEVRVQLKSHGPAPETATFKLQGSGDEANWYLSVSSFADAAAIDAMVQAIGAQAMIFAPLKQGLESGAMPPDMVLGQLETIANAAAAAKQMMKDAAAGMPGG